MTPQEKKNIIQRKAVEYSKEYDHLLLSWATGVGKTLAALKISLEYKNKPWLILCKETTHINEWKKEISVHKLNIDPLIICYSSLHKVKGDYNIICDEAHALTDIRTRLIFNNINYTKIIYLTATLPDNKSKYIMHLSKGKGRRYKISIDDAIEQGILPHPKIIVHYIQMNGTMKNKYLKLKKQIDSVQDEYYIKGTPEILQKLRFLGGIRKKMIARFKDYETMKLINILDGQKKRYICFTNNISQLEKLCKSNSFIHSKRKGKHINKQTIEDFNKGKTNHIFTVKMLTESANLRNIEAGVIIQLDSGKLTFLQRLGRVFRALIPELHVFVIKDSHDETFLKNALETIDNKYVNFVQH